VAPHALCAADHPACSTGGLLRKRLLAAMGWPGAGRSALQRRIVAALIVENEAWPFGEVLVESPGGLSLSEGR
jgi:hypothetical protein